ncbi:MAG: type IV pilus assembly protein PilM [Roseibacillus sp.]|nr:type IV pilus assembly protein PilM [Roseibacillus sp.]MDP7496144.1 type IV pilus assembly protein PilM [Roseibacillus sp.]
MADAESTVALSIGSQRISMAVFDPAKSGGLILKSYGSQSILADPSQEMMRLPQITLAVKELATALKVQKEKVRYSMSGQSVFTRFMKLPALQEDNIEELVKFEAQQHVPFPIEEVIWDWAMLDSTGPEKEVALVAIKRDALTEINATVAEAGIGTREVDAAPMALYNAFRYNYPEEDAPILLMDVGAKATNLVYIEGTRLFTRSIAVGAASVTTAIAKEYNISFAEAESQKITNGVVSLGGRHTNQLDEATAQLATVIRNSLNRLPAEVARTNSYYRSQQEGNMPTKVFLAGGGADLPYLPDFLEEKLRVPIELFNPLQRISIGKAIDVERLGKEAHMVGELVGLALRGVDQTPIRIDLVPDVVASQRATAERKPFLIAAAVIVMAGFAAWAMNKSVLAAEAEGMAEKLGATKIELAEPGGKIDQQSGRQSDLQDLADAYAGQQESRVKWIKVLGKVKDYFNDQDVWITDFEAMGLYKAGDDKSGEARAGQNFAKAPYGTSVLQDLKDSGAPAPSTRGSRRKKEPAILKPPQESINVIRLTGFWKGEEPTAVSKIVGKIRDDQGKEDAVFVLKKNPADPNSKNLADEEILPLLNSSITDKNKLAEQFVMILPLKNPISIK